MDRPSDGDGERTGEERDTGRDRADDAHRARDPEVGTEVRAGPALDRAAEVEEAVEGEEHHRHHTRDDVDLADEDAGLADREGEEEGVAGFVGLARALGEEPRRDAVGGHRLQDPRLAPGILEEPTLGRRLGGDALGDPVEHGVAHRSPATRLVSRR